MWTSARHLLSWTMLVLLALAVPLAARPHEPPSRAELLLAAFVLPDGTMPVICGQDDETGEPRGQAERCSLCVLAKAAVLGPAPAVPARAEVPARFAAWPAPRFAVASAWPQAPPARAPPSLLVA